MTASLTAMATVIWSDFAEASALPSVELSDDVPAPAPVKVAKIEHKQVEEVMVMPFEDEGPPTKKPRARKRRLDFGNFEGY